jgi:hypothetical protein
MLKMLITAWHPERPMNTNARKTKLQILGTFLWEKHFVDPCGIHYV